jgi:hypothetical protein
MKLKQNKERHREDYLHIIIIIAGLYAVINYLHSVLKLFIFEPNFCDFAHYYFFADLLSQGTNFLRLDVATVTGMMDLSDIPVHICHWVGIPIYSSVFFTFLMPFARLDFNAANLIWFLLNNAALLVSVLLLMRISDVGLNTLNISAVAFLVFSYQPLIEDIAIGQSNLLIFCMLVLTLWSVKSARMIMAGLFLAVAALIKPQYGFLALLFLLKRLYRPLLSTIVFYCLLTVASAYIVGWEFVIDFFTGLVKTGEHTISDITWQSDLSLLSAISRLLGGEFDLILKMCFLLFAVSIILYTVKILYGPYRKELFPLEFSWMLSLLIFLLPMLEEHYLVLMYIPIIIVYGRINHLEKSWQYLFILGFLLMALKYSLIRVELFHSGLLSIFYNGKLYGLMILLAIVHHEYIRARTAIDGQQAQGE